ncbi:hypothetical protein LCI18_013820 [Fusarium solani-melongenae]|uniref:Uncharacterized protein n=1 Tax=Fusarium solani subsp. cucurbitae TaxID=2747967 RepID=A0ACD3ZNS6_FUSSC|nr:hypothetical protein LCI18_013820 [Fusarium solani-melongenae]
MDITPPPSPLSRLGSGLVKQDQDMEDRPLTPPPSYPLDAEIPDSEAETKCLVQTINQTIDFQQQVQLCQNQKLRRAVDICVTHDCNVTEFFSYKKVAQKACGFPVTDRRREISIACLVVGVSAAILFAMRILSKAVGHIPWGHDDSLILAAFPVVVAFNVFCHIMPSKGLGLEIWTVRDEDITTFLIYLLCCEFAYAISLGLIKLSILLFFLRIFPSHKFQKVVRWTMGLTVLICLIYLILFLIQRMPLWLFWEGWKDKIPRGVIVDGNAMGISHGALNVALDIWMLILPLSQLLKLGVKFKKKVGVIAMFSVGLFLTIVSTIRIPSLMVFSTSWNVTADSVGIVIWSNVEVCVGMMVACMPHARQLVRDTMLQHGQSCLATSSSAEGIFINRSLRTI